MQVHADTLALPFEGLGQVQRTQPQAFFPGAGFRLDDGRLLGLIGRAKGEEIGRQQVGDGACIGHVLGGIERNLVGRTGQGANDLALDLQRHVDAASEIVLENRPGEGIFEMKPVVHPGIRRDHLVDLAPQQRPDRTVADRRWRMLAPGGVEARFIGGVILAVDHSDADIEMVVGNDM